MTAAQPPQVLQTLLTEFRKLKGVAERAMAQTEDDEFFRGIDPEANSIGLVVKHLAGSLRSRWTDFLTTDGEKPDRQRDREFVVEAADTRASLMEAWQRGWQCLFEAVEGLEPDDLERTVTIRGEPLPAVEATWRQLSHVAMHVGQIVLLAKHFRSSAWQTLSIPKGQSAQLNRKMRER